MTFTEALTIWREEVLADEATEQFSDADGTRLLKKAATEIAGALQLVRAFDETITASANATSFTAPSNLRAVFSGSLFIKGRLVELVPREVVFRKRHKSAGYPAYFCYDPDMGGNIEFAPATKFALTAGEIKFAYVTNYDATDAADSAEIWSGRYPEWHSIVPLYAGVATFNMIELYDRANHFGQLAMGEIQKFAAILGRTNLAKLLVPPQNRNDEAGDNL